MIFDKGIWRERSDAAGGSVGSDHKKAVHATLAKSLYQEWHIERRTLVIGEAMKTWDVVEA